MFGEVQTPMWEEMRTVEWFGGRTVAGAQSQSEKEAVGCEKQQAAKGQAAPGGCRGCNVSGFVEDAGVCVCV